MEEYRRIQKERHAEWKRVQLEEERKIKEEERRQQQLQEQKTKDAFLTAEMEIWMKEGFEPTDAQVIAMFQYQIQQILTHQKDVKEIHSKESVPKLFGVCGMADTQYFFFDLRLLMDHVFLMPQKPSSHTRHSRLVVQAPHPAPTLFHTGLALDAASWAILQEYWKVVDPYKQLEYKSNAYHLRLRTIENEPQTDEELQNYVYELCAKDPSQWSSPFEKDTWMGAFSVALPSTIMTGLLDQFTFDDQKSSSQPLAVELCIPGHTPRVFAYCRNPDECSNHGTIQVPWRLKYMMKAFEDQEVHVRVFVPPLIPVGPNLPALRVITVTRLPDTVSEGDLRTALNHTLNHQRIVFPGQVILAHLDNVYGPIPFMIAQVYTKNESSTFGRRPIAVTSVYGHGSGVDCAIETLHHSDNMDTDTQHESPPGFEKYYTYLCNLKRRSHETENISAPTPQMIAKSIQDQFFMKK